MKDPTEALPRVAWVPGKGRCRVLYYEGNGCFQLLTRRDERLFRHHSTFRFLKGRA